MQLVCPSPSVCVRDVTPFLMPFHIGYTGSAPVSTYFDAKTPTKPFQATPANGDASIASLPEAPGLPVCPEGTNNLQDTYTAAFRGRSLHGVRVPLPEGFLGYLLQSNEPELPEGSSKRKREDLSTSQPGKKARRPPRTRSVTVKEEIEEDMYAVMSRVEDEIEVEGVAPQSIILPEREFRPTGKFDSIVVWHPDVPVDRGKDEYVRAIDEWTRLSGIVSVLLYRI